MGGWGGLHSDFRVKQTRCVRLCWGWGFDNFIQITKKLTEKWSFCWVREFLRFLITLLYVVTSPHRLSQVVASHNAKHKKIL